jgi:Neprosin
MNAHACIPGSVRNPGFHSTLMMLCVLCSWLAAPAFAQQTNDFQCAKRTATAAPPPQSSVPKRAIFGRQTGPTLGQPLTAPADLCPDGEVPTLSEARVASTAGTARLMKGNPLLGSQPTIQLQDRTRPNHLRFEDIYGKKSASKQSNTLTSIPPCSGDCYYYAAAGLRRIADGAGVAISVHRPQYVNAGGSGHTLVELAVQAGPNDGNIVEVGWLVSTDQSGDSDPHIFVYHWLNGKETCYNGCGWQQVSNKYYPGQNISVLIGTDVYVGYVYYKGNWWAWFDTQWLGYFPGSIWQGAFSRSALIQWFGEVAIRNSAPKQIQMGDGELPPPPTAARMSTLCDVDAAAWKCWIRDKQILAAPTVPSFYNVGRVDLGNLRYGGPGQ